MDLTVHFAEQECATTGLESHAAHKHTIESGDVSYFCGREVDPVGNPIRADKHDMLSTSLQ